MSRFAWPNKSGVSFAVVVVEASICIEVSKAAVPKERYFVSIACGLLTWKRHLRVDKILVPLLALLLAWILVI
jgi:hypothetical protein